MAIQRLPCTFRLVLDALACLSGALFYSAAAWELLDLGLFTLETGETVDGAGELYPWFILLTVPGFVGQAVIMFLLFCTTLLNGDEKCAICGSNTATAATMSGVALPEMRRYGYNQSLSAGTVAVGALSA